MDKYLGKRLGGRYEIIDVVGVGGMAVVFRARDHVLGRYVAVKILKDEFAKDPDVQKRFSIESKAVAKLSHQNIVAVYDVGKENGVDYIVMELIEGITLKEYLQKKGRLSWQESIFFAQQICRALVHAHSRGIIHRDIKPQNVIILRDGTAKLTDFGIASFASTQETRVVQEAIGSVHYISPEQAKGGQIDYRTDIYSLGVVMYEMLTGKLPFTGETAIQVVMQHINATPLSPREIIPEVPEGLSAIVMHAMCAMISKRYSSAEELYNDLEKLRNNAGAHFEFGADEDETHVIGPEVRQAARRAAAEERTAPKRKTEKKPAVPEPEHEPEHEGFFDRLSERPGLAAGIAVTVFACIALVVAGLLIFTGKSSEDMLDVPTMVGKSIDEIMADEEIISKFTIKEADNRVESERPEGEVLDQDPKAGSKVVMGTNVVLTVSAGGENVKDTFKVVEFAGRTLEYAQQYLNAHGVGFDVEEEYSDSVEKDRIIRTSPDIGAVLEKDEKITLYVSKGKEIKETQVPGIVGMSQSDAERALSNRGLRIGSVDPVESSEAEGTVLWQSIQEGASVSEGTTVNVQVSTGKKQQTPDTTQAPEGDPEGNQPSNGDDDGQVEEPEMGYANVPVPLPDSTDMAHVQIFVDGNVEYDSTLETNAGYTEIRVSATVGQHEVTTKIDDTTTTNTMMFTSQSAG